MIDTNALRKKVIDLAVAGKLNEHITLKANDELDSIKESLGNTCSRSISIEEKWTVIPDNWTWARLADITTNESLNDGNWVLSDDMVSEGEVKLIQLASIGDCEYKYKGFKYLTKEHFRELNGKQIYPGYLLINRLVVDKMMTCLIPDIEGILMTAVDVCWVAPNDELYNIEYLMYAMSSSGVQQRVKELGHGVTRFRISKLNLIDIAFPLPPLEEQKTIVEKINELLSLLNCIDTLQEKYNSDLEVLKTKIIDAGIRGKLTEQLTEDGAAEDLYTLIQEEKTKLIKEGKIKKEKALPEISDDEIPFEIPQNWKWVRLYDLVTVLGDGLHGTPSYDEEGEFYFINGNNLQDGKIVIRFNTKRINEKESEKYRKDFSDKTILISINGTLGNIAFYNNEKVVLGKSACFINLLMKDVKYYLFYVLKSSYFISYANYSATGVTIKNVSLKAMKEFCIPLPPLPEQKRISLKISELLKLLT